MHSSNEAYLDRLLLSAEGLPEEVQVRGDGGACLCLIHYPPAPLLLLLQAQIRTEVQAQLEAKVDGLLAAVIPAAQAREGGEEK
jgi:hypothetical protein